MDKALLAAYLATDFRARLPQGGFASLRIGATLPPAVLQLTHGAPWGVITAWNPRSQPMPRAWNRRAQRQLLAELRQHPQMCAIHAAVGVGANGWRESSLLLIGPGEATLRALCARHGQHAFVAAEGEAPPRLCWTDEAPRASAGDRPPHGQGRRPLRTIDGMSAAPLPLLEARALSFLRQDEPVFGPLHFQLHAGELALVEGDNGSGKTTLMRVLAGLLHVDEGELRWRGAPLVRDACQGEIVFLGHQLGLKGDLSPRENLRIAAGLHGCRPGMDPTAALREVGLSGYEDEPVRQLSAGQKKRAALARLLLIPATLWLLDEPYANLDRHGIALVNRLLETHIVAGGAALVTSHGAVSFHGGEPQRIRMHA